MKPGHRLVSFVALTGASAAVLIAVERAAECAEASAAKAYSVRVRIDAARPAHTISPYIAQAEILGILARERVDYAYLWAGLTGVQRFAFLLFRNPDGRRQGFGERYLTTRSDKPNRLSAFAARRSDGALTVVLINKDLEQPAEVRLESTPETAAPSVLFRLPNPPGPIVRELAQQKSGARTTVAVPPLSAVLAVFSAKRSR